MVRSNGGVLATYGWNVVPGVELADGEQLPESFFGDFVLPQVEGAPVSHTAHRRHHVSAPRKRQRRANFPPLPPLPLPPTPLQHMPTVLLPSDSSNDSFGGSVDETASFLQFLSSREDDDGAANAILDQLITAAVTSQPPITAPLPPLPPHVKCDPSPPPSAPKREPSPPPPVPKREPSPPPPPKPRTKITLRLKRSNIDASPPPTGLELVDQGLAQLAQPKKLVTLYIDCEADIY